MKISSLLISLKSKDENLKVVFIGPCVAKKQEAMNEWSQTDYVLTNKDLKNNSLNTGKIVKINPAFKENILDLYNSNADFFKPIANYIQGLLIGKGFTSKANK